jgi:hypothetical protein
MIDQSRCIDNQRFRRPLAASAVRTERGEAQVEVARRPLTAAQASAAASAPQFRSLEHGDTPPQTRSRRPILDAPPRFAAGTASAAEARAWRGARDRRHLTRPLLAPTAGGAAKACGSTVGGVQLVAVHSSLRARPRLGFARAHAGTIFA